MFCTQCGSPLEPNARFCGTCGKPVSSPQAPAKTPEAAIPAPTQSPVLAPTAPHQAPQASVAPPPTSTLDSSRPAEPILAVADGLFLGRGFGRRDGVHLIITDRRMVFATITSDMIKAVGQQAYREARESGKGRFAAAFGSIGADRKLVERYQSMPLEEVLKEHPDNLSIDLSQVRQVKVKRGKSKGMVKSSGFFAGGTVYGDGKMELYSSAGKYEFGVLASYLRQTIEALKSAGIQVED